MIFADTGFLFALFSKRDRHHARVVEVFKTFEDRRLPDEILTTDLVVLETITLARKRVSHAAAVFGGERLYSEKLARIHHTTPEEHLAGFEYLKRHQDQHYSAVDCVSFVVMQALGIHEALAVDSDFTHQFVARPGPLR